MNDLILENSKRFLSLVHVYMINGLLSDFTIRLDTTISVCIYVSSCAFRASEVRNFDEIACKCGFFYTIVPYGDGVSFKFNTGLDAMTSYADELITYFDCISW